MIRREHTKFYLREGDVASLGQGCYYLDCITLLNDDAIFLGDDVIFGADCWINGYGTVVIESGAMIGPGTIIHSANHARDEDGNFLRDKWDPQQTVIGKGVWLGAGCILTPGTRIGDGSVAGAGAILSGIYKNGSRILANKATSR